MIISLPSDSSVLRTGGKGCLVEFGVKMIMEHLEEDKLGKELQDIALINRKRASKK